MSTIPLRSAYWCENCQCVMQNSTTCEACGTSNNIIHLTRWIHGIQTDLGHVNDTGPSAERRVWPETARQGSEGDLRQVQALREMLKAADSHAAPQALPSLRTAQRSARTHGWFRRPEVTP